MKGVSTTKREMRGQSMLEFVLILPILLFMITVFIDLGRGIFYYSSLTNAVREATRYAVVHKIVDDDADTIVVLKHAAAGVNPDNISVDIVAPTSADEQVTITATYFFDPVTPGLELIVGSSGGITLTVRSQMETAPLYQD
jgi:Flp pilus assembly protein TadG